MKSLLRKGTWTPLLPYEARIFVVMLPCAEAILRGIDYVTGDQDSTTQSLTFVEKAMPLAVWGVLFLVAGLLTALGFWRKWVWVCVAGLHVGGATYMSMAVGLAAKAWERGGDGFRTPVMFVVFALAFWGMAIGYSMQARDDYEKRKALGWERD